MKCIECGHELKDGAIFCIRCGAMQVSMDGKPIERGADWPTVEAKTDGAGFRSSTDGALHSAQSKNPRGFQSAPKRNGGKIAAIVIAVVALIAIIAFAVTQCAAPAATSTSSTQSSVTTSTASESASATSSTSSASASASTTSASASAASASAAAAASTAAASQQSTTPAATETQQAQQTQPAQPAPEPAPEPVYNDYYVLPSSSSYYYSYDELSGMSTYDLYIARNEIYARHGRMFNRSDLQEYFNAQAWYEPIYTAAQFDSMGDSMLTDAEIQNAKLMKRVEADKGSPYL